MDDNVIREKLERDIEKYYKQFRCIDLRRKNTWGAWDMNIKYFGEVDKDGFPHGEGVYFLGNSKEMHSGAIGNFEHGKRQGIFRTLNTGSTYVIRSITYDKFKDDSWVGCIQSIMFHENFSPWRFLRM